MTTNDLLRRLRYALRLDDATSLAMMALGGLPATAAQLDSWFAEEGSPGFADCPDRAFLALLDGVIETRRGPSGHPRTGTERLDNNLVLKKLRVALELREEDLMTIMNLGGMEPSKGEIAALFRKPGTRNYRECMDQFLRAFFAGLARYKTGQGGAQEAHRG